MMEEQYDVQCVAVTTDLSDDDLREMMRGIFPHVIKSKMGFFLTISGYDDDPRELWDIPEAIDLCKRLVSTGFISLLEVSCSEQYGRFGTQMPGWGALEVWLLAKGRLKLGDTLLTKEMLKEFIETLDQSNATCDKVAGRPKKKFKPDWRPAIDPRMF